MVKNNSKEQLIEDEFSDAQSAGLLLRLERVLVNFFGSWLFFILNVGFFVFWILSGRYYDLLTFWVSLEAIILSILILINQNREMRGDRQRAIKDYKIDFSIAKKVKKMEKDLEEIKELLERS